MTPKYSIGQKVLNVYGIDTWGIAEIRITADQVLYRRATGDTWIAEDCLVEPTARLLKLNARRLIRDDIASSRRLIKHFVKAIKEAQARILQNERELALRRKHA